MIRATVSRTSLALSRDRDLVLEGAAHDLVADVEVDALTPVQQALKLAAAYAALVENGGHLAYFASYESENAGALLIALQQLGALQHHAIFAKAVAYAKAHPVDRDASIDNYVRRLRRGEFEDWDRAFYASECNLARDLLPAFIRANLEEFVEFVD